MDGGGLDGMMGMIPMVIAGGIVMKMTDNMLGQRQPTRAYKTRKPKRKARARSPKSKAGRLASPYGKSMVNPFSGNIRDYV